MNNKVNMNAESMLKLQSWVDGELSEAEAREVASWVQNDPQAAALVAELRTTHSWLAPNEPEVRLAETREFYWSRIERELQRTESASSSERLPWILALRRLLVPISGFALIAFVTVLSLGVFNRQDSGDFGQLVEVENLSEGIDSMSYKSQSENMFVVYVFDKDSSGEVPDDADFDFEMDDDSVIQ